MATQYTHFLVSYVVEAKRDDARDALASAAGVQVAGYGVELEPTVIGEGLPVPVAYAEWSACRPLSLQVFGAVAAEVCGGVPVEVEPGIWLHAGVGGGWKAWPRLATPADDKAAALAWLESLGWAVKTEVEP